MTKKNKIILIIIIAIVIAIASLYGTFAMDTQVTQTDPNTYNIVLTDKRNELTMPANTNKTIIYQLHNPNNGTVKYNIGFSGTNIDVKQYSNSDDSASGLIGAKEYKFIKLRVENTGNNESTAVLSTVLGYEHGGELISPSNIILVTDIYNDEEDTPSLVNIANYIRYLYNTKTKTTVTHNNITYNYVTSVNLMNDRLGGTTKSLDGGNIRYYGSTPNNYIDIGDTYKEDILVKNWLHVYRNEEAESLGITDSTSCLNFMQKEGITDEIARAEIGLTVNEICSTTTIHAGDPILYRIIGVFNGKAKLIRDESIGKYSWDTSDESINYGYGINEWSQADLMKLINPGFTGTGGSLWYNGSSGECYTEYNNETSACDFTSAGLNNQVKPLIADDIWYLGGMDYSEIYVDEMYGYERKNNVYQIGSNDNYNDEVTRQPTWTGKIGLMYTSDFFYAVDFNSCTESAIYYTGTCITSNWLNIGGSQWAITPALSKPNAAWLLINGSIITKLDVRPVFSLITSAKMEVHEGTKEDPYVLSLS